MYGGGDTVGRRIRIGIDVGGTFTDAVAIDADTLEVVGTIKIPTTHHHENGVAEGVVQSLQHLIREIQADPEEIIFIAYGTTQATNALLEGDVSKVGIFAMSKNRLQSIKVKRDTRIHHVKLGGKPLKTEHVFRDSRELSDEDIEAGLRELVEKKVEVIVASEVFSVDDPVNEDRVVEMCKSKGLLVTSTHAISKLYGLRARTRTAAINASILPRMIQMAELTKRAIQDSGMKAPLMIMRCDGGVMQVDEVKERPILTCLSGPAAGVAGALMYENVSDGFFLEVGGTSTDISAIRNGKVMVKYNEIGGHSTYVRALDVRTIGIGGGSLIRATGEKIVDVGPRSAHIAGYPYACFAGSAEEFDGAAVESIAPVEGDAADHVIIRTEKNRYALTLTCVSNALGYVTSDHYAYADREVARAALKVLARHMGKSMEEVGRRILDCAVKRIEPTVRRMIDEYGIPIEHVELTGGGGGCASVVPAVAEAMKVRFKIARNHQYISPIGAALAMVRDTVERTIVNPTNEDIVNLRKEAEQRAIRSGAVKGSIEVTVDMDPDKNIVRATAVGSTDVKQGQSLKPDLRDEELAQIAADHFAHIETVSQGRVARTDHFSVYEAEEGMRGWRRLLRRRKRHFLVLDRKGIVRLRLLNAVIEEGSNGEVQRRLGRWIEQHTKYDVGGEKAPDVYLLVGNRVIDFVGVPSGEQLLNMAKAELANYPSDEAVVLLGRVKSA